MAIPTQVKKSANFFVWSTHAVENLHGSLTVECALSQLPHKVFLRYNNRRVEETTGGLRKNDPDGDSAMSAELTFAGVVQTLRVESKGLRVLLQSHHGS